MSKGFKRLVIEAALRDIKTFIVHPSLRYRRRQDKLRDHYEMVRHTIKPVIVAGDSNVFRGRQELVLFTGVAGLVSANTRDAPSHPSRMPRRQLAFILHHPAIQAKRFEAPAVPFSDHIPLIGDLEVRPALAA